MDIIKDIYLDFYDKSQSSVSAKESDNGRYIRAVVTAGGREYQIPEGVKAYLASGNVYRVCEIEDNRILAGLTPEMLTPGHHPAQIELMSTDKKLTSMSFELLVEPSARNINAEQSEGKLDLLDVLIQKAIESVEKAEGAAEATEAANQAADRANDAAANADTATTNADTATGKANQATTAANQAADRANDAAANAEQFEVDQKTVAFTEAAECEPLESGDTVSILFGKTKKWLTELGWSVEGLIGKFGNCLTDENLNTILDAGTYFAAGGNGCTEKPPGVDSFGLAVLRCASGYWCQILVSTKDTTLHVRTGATDWGEWKRLASAAEVAALETRIQQIETVLNQSIIKK